MIKWSRSHDHDCRSVLWQKKMFFSSFVYVLITEAKEVFCKRGVLKNFIIFTGKYACWRLQRTCFPVNISNFLRTHFLRTSATAASVTKALIVWLLSLVMIQTYKTFWILIFTTLHANLATKIREHGDISYNSNVTIIWKYRKR